MYSAFLRLGSRDFINGLVVAVIAAVGSLLVQSADAGTLNIFTYDWVEAGKLALNVSVVYLLKNLLTTDNGKVLGKI